MVSIVVCSYNGARTLRDCLGSLQNLNYPKYEVVFIDDGSKDNTQEIMKDFPRVRKICAGQQGPERGAQRGHRRGPGRDCRLHRFRLHGRSGLALLSRLRVALRRIRRRGRPEHLPAGDEWVHATVGAAPGGRAMCC